MSFLKTEVEKQKLLQLSIRRKDQGTDKDRGARGQTLPFMRFRWEYHTQSIILYREMGKIDTERRPFLNTLREPFFGFPCPASNAK